MSNPTSILTVSQLNRQVKSYLENEMGIIHVEGEVSNLSKPYSGHYYFTLKDSGAQLRCVFFKNRHVPPLSGQLSDGQLVVASGRLSLYEARGDYQLIVEQLTNAGLGALYQRFEALKQKLAAEGLFDATRKKAIPAIPKTIGIISSPSGAALRDILSTLARRFPLALVRIYPSEVQGASAPQQLIKSLQFAVHDQRCDVLILARGGGSIEDLWAFNDEQLARQIVACPIPVVSGVGHETDFTIADFVADYRAETPTAAAVAVTPDCLELQANIYQAKSHLIASLSRLIKSLQIKLEHLVDRVSSPQKAIASHWQGLDLLARQLLNTMTQLIQQRRHRLDLCQAQLQTYNPKTQVTQAQMQMQQLTAKMIHLFQNKINLLKYQLKNNLATLHAVSPLATLDRGYAIAYKNGTVLFTPEQVQIGDRIDLRLAKGSLACQITQIKD